MSITVPALSTNPTRLPPEVVIALNITPSTSLVYEIGENGQVILTAIPGTTTKANLKKNATFAKLAGTFPKTKPGIPPATEADVAAAIAKGAVIRFDR